VRALALLAVAAAVIAVAACPPSPPANAPPGPQQVLPPEPKAPPRVPIVSIFDAGSPEALSGANCDTDADCGSGVCEGFGCGAGQGICMPADRRCTRDLRPYCGCDGATFRASGSCPGQRYAHRGECGAPRAAGGPCAADDQCASGICEGPGCGEAETGVCAAAGRMCTADVVPYCGCDGKTFGASSGCPQRRFAHRGKCK